jgi:hypothetical protein
MGVLVNMRRVALFVSCGVVILTSGCAIAPPGVGIYGFPPRVIVSPPAVYVAPPVYYYGHGYRHHHYRGYY